MFNVKEAGATLACLLKKNQKKRKRSLPMSASQYNSGKEED